MANTPGQRQRPLNGDRIEESRVGSMQEPITGSERQYGDRVGSSNSSFGARDEAIREETIDRNLGARDEATSSYKTADTMATDTMATRTERRADRGFTTTFAIAAIVLLGAFLVALYLGSRSSDVASNPDNQTPVTQNAPATGTGSTGTTTNDATGSTTPAPAPSDSTTTVAPSNSTAPATPPANTTTGTGTTAPANP